MTNHAARSRTPEAQRNLDHVLGLFRDVLAPLDADQVDRYIGPDYIQHSPMAAPGRESLKAFLRTVHAASPNASQRLLRAFVDADHVIIHYHVKKDPQDRGFVVMDIFRLSNGMVVEHWDCVQDVPADSPNPISMF
ncbi:MAG TPA: nuclear transport factor 2 family protein [Steroidobacteraceae bacterium]|jgi:predicted SnoaL-like aldol condensation-catalyzing enzyme|nr:nuclear transport factor 2 family protein [Steroidobacteraceae bacterium]